MKNENKVDEIVAILSTLQEYVPTQKLSANLKVPGKDKVTVERMHQLLFGGDQLTVAQAKRAQRVGRTHSMLRDVWRDFSRSGRLACKSVPFGGTVHLYYPGLQSICILFYSCVHMRLCR